MVEIDYDFHIDFRMVTAMSARMHYDNGDSSNYSTYSDLKTTFDGYNLKDSLAVEFITIADHGSDARTTLFTQLAVDTRYSQQVATRDGDPITTMTGMYDVATREYSV